MADSDKHGDTRAWKDRAGVDLFDGEDLKLTVQAVALVNALGKHVGSGETPVFTLDEETRSTLLDIRELLGEVLVHLSLITDLDKE